MLGGLFSPVSQAGGEDFDGVLKTALDSRPDKKVGGEELFAAAVHERLAALKGEKVAARYQEIFSEQREKLQSAGSAQPVREAAENALQALVAEERLSADEAARIRGDAFAACAQQSPAAGGRDAPLAKLQSAVLRAHSQIAALAGG